MQKLWINYCRKTKQNDEIILHNSQLYKVSLLFGLNNCIPNMSAQFVVCTTSSFEIQNYCHNETNDQPLLC